MDVSHVLGQPQVLLKVRFVEKEEKKIEARKKGSREVDVLKGRLLGIVAAIGRVGSSEDGGSGVQGGVDSCLGNGDCLLLHHLVDGRPVCFIHFVKLVNAAHSVVSKNKGTPLYSKKSV